MAQDRVIKGASDGRLYRVLAGEAHSWNYLLIEDQLGERFRIDTRSRSLNAITDSEVESLLKSRAYRPWSGSRLWASLNELPLAPSGLRRTIPSTPVLEVEQPPDSLADA